METISRKRNGYASLLLGCVAVLSCTPARAQEDQSQQETIALPDINVTNTRLLPGPSRALRRAAGHRRRAPAPAPAAATPATAPRRRRRPKSSRVPASSPAPSSPARRPPSSPRPTSSARRARRLQDILAREPGIQTTSLFGSVNGAQTTVDMRGFGATGASNTLVLVNGRRLNDIDLAGIDFSAIPKNSIERIEITRGNSGAVLYGDGAVGGVINIITKTGVGPAAVGAHPGQRSARTIIVEGNVSANALVRAIGRAPPTPMPFPRTAIAITTSFARRTRSAICAGTTGRGPPPISTSPATTSISACRAGCARVADLQSAPDRPARRGDAVRFRQQAGHERHARRHPHAVAGHRADRRRRRPAEEPAGRASSVAFSSDFDRGFKATLTACLVHAAPDQPAQSRRHDRQADHRRRRLSTRPMAPTAACISTIRPSIATISRRRRQPAISRRRSACCRLPTSPSAAACRATTRPLATSST